MQIKGDNTYSTRHLTLWGIISVVTTLILNRLHYWLPGLPKFHLWQYDSQWWWGYQNSLQNPTIYANDSFYAAREQWRFYGDRLIAEAIVFLSNSSGVDRETLNLAITTANFSVAIFGVFLLALYLAKSPVAAAFSAIIFSQSPYMRWLSYEFVVPKMFAFALFPYVILATVMACRKGYGFLVFALANIASLLIYPTSTVYYLPSLSAVAFFSILFFEQENRKALLSKLAAACSAIFIVIIFLQRNKVGLRPPPKEISEYFYKTPVLDAAAMQQYLADYGLYSAFAMVSWLALTLWTKDIFLKRAAHFLFALAVGLLASGITGHFLADKIDSVKMAWYWRASYYSFLPLSLLSSIAIYQLAIKNRPRYIALRISLLSIVLFIYTTPDGIYSTAKSNLETTTKIHNGEIQDRYNTELKQIINTINSSQASSAVLFPPKSFQGSNTDIIESQLQRKVILSKSNMGLMIVETDVTKEYYLLLKRYDEIAAISNATALTEKLSQFAGELKATYLLWPKKGIAQPGLEPIETFNHWTLYQFAN